MRAIWHSHPTTRKAAERGISLARAIVDNRLSKLNGVHYLLSCITGTGNNRYVMYTLFCPLLSWHWLYLLLNWWHTVFIQHSMVCNCWIKLEKRLHFIYFIFKLYTILFFLEQSGKEIEFWYFGINENSIIISVLFSITCFSLIPANEIFLLTYFLNWSSHLKWYTLLNRYYVNWVLIEFSLQIKQYH